MAAPPRLVFMRAATKRAMVAFGLTAAILCACTSEPVPPAPVADADVPQAKPEWRIPRTADAAELRAAIAERAVFDGVTVEVPDGGTEIVLRRDQGKFGQYDWIADQVLALDEDIGQRAKLRELPDADLQRRFDSMGIHAYEEGWTWDRVLLEIVRRGASWRERVGAKLAAQPGRDKFERCDVELLIALRRIDGKPAPLRVETEASQTSAYPDLPRAVVRVVNRDSYPITVTRGGNYRGGRLERWNFEVRDAGGRLMPALDWKSGMGGGISSRRPLAPRESIAQTLPMSEYVGPLAPGEYRVRIHYHDSSEIAHPGAYPGHVTIDSDEIVLRVLPRVVETTPAEQERLARLVESLPSSGKAVLLEEPYGPWAHGVIAPDSAAGRLLAAGWKAVPALLRLAASESADPARRASAFALLASISDAFAACLDYSVLGGCDRYRLRDGRAEIGGGSGVSRVDAVRQTQNAAEWTKLASGVEFRETR